MNPKLLVIFYAMFFALGGAIQAIRDGHQVGEVLTHDIIFMSGIVGAMLVMRMLERGES